MAKTTSQAITFESYNSTEFFSLKMNEYVKSGIISHWYAMPHLAEKNGKDHIHCVCFPSLGVRLNIAEFSSSFLEIGVTEHLAIDPSHYIEKSFYDSLKYFQHDTAYLLSKGMIKEYYDYPFERFLTDDCEWFSEFYAMNNDNRLQRLLRVAEVCGSNGLLSVCKNANEYNQIVKLLNSRSECVERAKPIHEECVFVQNQTENERTLELLEDTFT